MEGLREARARANEQDSKENLAQGPEMPLKISEVERTVRATGSDGLAVSRQGRPPASLAQLGKSAAGKL